MRYCDDFIILGRSAAELAELIPRIGEFLRQALQLDLHPKKVTIRKVSQGVDFLGYVALPHYRVVRASTRRRMFRKVAAAHTGHISGEISEETLSATVNSYRGILSHAKGHILDTQLLNLGPKKA